MVTLLAALFLVIVGTLLIMVVVFCLIALLGVGLQHLDEEGDDKDA